MSVSDYMQCAFWTAVFIAALMLWGAVLFKEDKP